MTRTLATLALGILIGALLVPRVSASHWQPGRHNAVHAIHTYFGPHWRDAANVSYCEASAYHWLTTGRPWDAGNGQFRGMFQMGSWERATYGNGPGPWNQARAASRYFRASGSDWSPWECKPWWNPMPFWLVRGIA